LIVKGIGANQIAISILDETEAINKAPRQCSQRQPGDLPESVSRAINLIKARHPVADEETNRHSCYGDSSRAQVFGQNQAS